MERMISAFSIAMISMTFSLSASKQVNTLLPSLSLIHRQIISAGLSSGL